VQAFEGVHRFAVQVPGVGFGATGRIEIIGSKVAQAALPPLARFARVEGRMAPALLAPGTTVSLLAEPFQEPVGPAAPCDEKAALRWSTSSPARTGSRPREAARTHGSLEGFWAVNGYESRFGRFDQNFDRTIGGERV
jgi:hypothetical protein